MGVEGMPPPGKRGMLFAYLRRMLKLDRPLPTGAKGAFILAATVRNLRMARPMPAPVPAIAG